MTENIKHDWTLDCDCFPNVVTESTHEPTERCPICGCSSYFNWTQVYAHFSEDENEIREFERLGIL